MGTYLADKQREESLYGFLDDPPWNMGTINWTPGLTGGPCLLGFIPPQEISVTPESPKTILMAIPPSSPENVIDIPNWLVSKEGPVLAMQPSQWPSLRTGLARDWGISQHMGQLFNGYKQRGGECSLPMIPAFQRPFRGLLCPAGQVSHIWHHTNLRKLIPGCEYMAHTSPPSKLPVAIK